MTSQTTQAWRYHKGGLLPNTLKLDEVEVPKPGKGEILVDVEFSSLNPVDYKIAQHLSLLAKKPRTAAADFYGKVAELGPETESKGLKIGEAVFGLVPADVALRSGRGSLSKKLLISSQYVEKALEKYSPEQLGSISLVGLTALELASFTQPGQRVLVCGGSTAVGLLLTKMLKAKGCSLVVATGSGSKLETIKSRGADDVVDYRAADFPKALVSKYSKDPFDIVLDTVGDQATHSGCGSYLKKGAHYYNVGANSLTPGAGGLIPMIKFVFSALILPTFLGGVPAKFHMVELKKEKLPDLAQLANEVDLDPLIDSTFPFSEAPKAYQRLMEGRALGKVVVEVKT